MTTKEQLASDAAYGYCNVEGNCAPVVLERHNGKMRLRSGRTFGRKIPPTLSISPVPCFRGNCPRAMLQRNDNC
jgi:hypothetical protein